MKLVTFKGYAGNGHGDSKENEAMGLIVGRKYVVIGYWNCGDGCLSPTVSNEHGKPKELCHDEVEELEGN